MGAMWSHQREWAAPPWTSTRLRPPGSPQARNAIEAPSTAVVPSWTAASSAAENQAGGGVMTRSLGSTYGISARTFRDALDVLVMIAATTVLEALGRGLPGDRLVVDPDVLAAISHDEAEWAPAGKAVAGVRARTEAEVQHVVRTCAELGAPIVPRGAGTGLSGGANAVSGSVVLDLSRMNQVLEVDPDNLVCVVQPGAVNNDLKAAVAEHGLWYPPDPASAPWSTIGGNVATNAGGLCCLKYGVTRDYVLALEAVVGGPAGDYGTAVRLGHNTTKGVSGYDLTSL